jgi:hypothetical protein
MNNVHNADVNLIKNKNGNPSRRVCVTAQFILHSVMVNPQFTTAVERNKLIHSLNASSKFYTYRGKKDFCLHNSLLLPFILPTTQFPKICSKLWSIGCIWIYHSGMFKMFSVAMPELRILLSCDIFSEWRRWNQEPENLNYLNGWTQHIFLSLLPLMLWYSTHSAITVQRPVFTFPSMDKCSFTVTENIIKPGDYSCKISTLTFSSNFLGKALEFNTVAERFRLLNQPSLYII